MSKKTLFYLLMTAKETLRVIVKEKLKLLLLSTVSLSVLLWGFSTTEVKIEVATELSTTFDEILVERVRVRIQKLGSRVEDNYVFSSSFASSSSAKDEDFKNKKDDEAEVPTELWVRWLNDDIRHKISKTDWDESIPVIQGQFLLPRWRRNLTRSFCQWMNKKTVRRSKHNQKKKMFESEKRHTLVSL